MKSLNFFLQTLTILMLSIVLVIFTGCAGTQKKSKKPQRPVSPFGTVSTDLKSELGASSQVKTSYDETDIDVPGFGYGRKKAKKGDKKIPFSDAISGQMEGISWGLHYKAVLNIFEEKIKATHREALVNSGGAVEEDKVRTKIQSEISKLKRSYIEFKGQRTGFEGSLIAAEFTHNNNESMMVWDAEKFVEYLFFIDGRFWKRIRAFRKDKLSADITFDTYSELLETRFGEGSKRLNKKAELASVKWKDEDTYVEAMDKSGFFGVYCLKFSAIVSEDNIDRLRINKGRAKGKVDDNVSSMIDSVTAGDLTDHNSSVVDSFTGTSSGASKNQQIDTSHSVMSRQRENDGKNKNKKKKKPAGDPDIDDLF